MQIVATGVASFLAIFPLCAWRHLDIIEKDLLERSEEALRAERISGIEIEISGRDLLISAAAPGSDLATAQALLSDIYGVRVVRSDGRDAGQGGAP